MQMYIKSLFSRLLLFLLLIPCQVSAQMLKSAGDENLHFGLSVGGACNTTFPTAGAWHFDNRQTKIGFTGGAFFELDFAKRFFAHFEVNISARRLLANGSSADTNLRNYDLSIHYTNINVPLGLGVSIFPAPSQFNVSFIACAVLGLPQYNKSQISVNRQDVEHSLQVINVGALAEVRFKYEFIFLAFRYEFSGMDLFRYKHQAFKTGTFSFMLGFQII